MSLNEQAGGGRVMSDNRARRSVERPRSQDDLPVMPGHYSHPPTAEGFSEAQLKQHLCKAHSLWSGWCFTTLLIHITSL